MLIVMCEEGTGTGGYDECEKQQYSEPPEVIEREREWNESLQ
jgi:hypothetical protein